MLTGCGNAGLGLLNHWLTKKKYKWVSSQDYYLSLVGTHQCQCTSSPAESQSSCTESGHTEKQSSATLFSGTVYDSSSQQIVSILCAWFHFYITLAWFPHSNSASSWAAMNWKNKMQESRETFVILTITAHSVSFTEYQVNLPCFIHNKHRCFASVSLPC